ncbi:hypothetical protein K435DRAFT_797260 [Dendrothele bispora CBS 962.96]|uniref:Uncharacterized protein n=1 Tax=Dendrothele bispora (strain CBS 962.96) TaxID=1314807 RepID=A0A4S8M310_DENBC|nr:hypothetical protein K435DRAFT_797260 [Dendrothele bispora CBS 962.96]
MTREERIVITDNALAQMEKGRENRFIGNHNTPLSSFHNAWTTLESIQLELQRLNARTGTEAVLIATRSDIAHYLKPDVFQTSDRINEFFVMSVKQPVGDLAVRMEAYMLSGVQGLVHNHQQHLQAKKTEVVNLIKSKLQECAGRHNVPRMVYVNFHEHITHPYQIVVKNWPLPKFCSPSSHNSMAEVELLLNAWTSNTTHFHKFSDAEYNKWENSGFEEAMAVTTMTSRPTQSTPPSQAPDNAADPPTPTESPDLSPEGHPSTPPNNSDPSPEGPSEPASGDEQSAHSAPVQPQSITPFTTNFINNTVTGSNGQMVFVAQKKQKERSDKGKPWGKKKKARTDENTNTR